MGLVREVWSHNLRQELAVLDACLSDFPVVAIDTEFPGFIKCSPRGAPEGQFYDDLKFNVNQMTILQLGLTVADESGNVGMTWQFNFSDFDETTAVHSRTSVEFLKNTGLDFEKLRTEGIASGEFRREFLPICCGGRIAKWVTFHGFYDVAYLLKLLMVRILPESMQMFAAKAQRLLGTVSDLKHMARHCESLLNGELGLERLAKLLRVSRTGTAHHAGSDSLLTASVYAKMKEKFEFSSEHFDGFLYGLRYRIRGPIVKIAKPSLPPLLKRPPALPYYSRPPFLVDVPPTWFYSGVFISG